MNTALLERVRVLRASNPYQPISTQTAVRVARYEQNPPCGAYMFLLNIQEGTCDSVDGVIGDHLMVQVAIVDDDISRLGEDDVTGTFTDVYVEGCVKNTCRNWGTDYQWYRPSTVRRGTTLADYQRYGLSKARAVEAMRWGVQQDMKDDASRRYHGVRAIVRVDGEIVGEDSLWGIDLIGGYDSRSHMIATAVDCIEEALNQARQESVATVARARRHAARLAEALGVNEGEDTNGAGQG